MFTNLTPYIPLSFKGEGDEIYREGFHPSLTYTGALNSLPLLREGVRDGLLNNLMYTVLTILFNDKAITMIINRQRLWVG